MLKEYRIKRGYTLEQLAEMCDISWRNLHRIENGQYKYAKFETIQKLIMILGLTEKDIVAFIKDKSN